MTPVATGAITDGWRHSSRAAGFEMWSSMIGPSKVDSASWIERP